jgi:hypothetical protein
MVKSLTIKLVGNFVTYDYTSCPGGIFVFFYIIWNYWESAAVSYLRTYIEPFKKLLNGSNSFNFSYISRYFTKYALMYWRYCKYLNYLEGDESV